MTLDELLRTHGMSARQLALRGGPPMSTLRAWRRGRMPKQPTIERIARVLGLDVATVADAAAATVAQARIATGARS